MSEPADPLDIPYLAVAFGERLPLSWAVEHTRAPADRGPTDPIHRAWRKSKSPGKMLTMVRELGIQLSPLHSTGMAGSNLSHRIVQLIPRAAMITMNRDVSIRLTTTKRTEPLIFMHITGPGLAMSIVSLRLTLSGSSDDASREIVRAIRKAVPLRDVMTLKEVLEAR